MRVAAISLAVVLLAACNKSPVPIDDLAAAPFDSALIGMWQHIDPENDTVYLSVAEFRAPEYLIAANNAEGARPLSDDPPVYARGYITRVGGVSFMNVDNVFAQPRGYVLYRFSLKGDTLFTDELNEAAHKFQTSAELRHYLVANLHDDALYPTQGRARFVRVDPTATRKAAAR